MSLRLESLDLCNFKSFAGEHTFDFDQKPGLYYVTGVNKVEPALGANGAGKSSLWDALLWCGYGETARSNRPSGDIVTWTSKKEPTYVELKFQRDNHAYRLLRSRNPNGLVLTTDGVEKAVEQHEVDKVIGLSKEAFRRTILIPQFGTVFLNLTPQVQSQLFTEILNLDLWIRASDRASKMAKVAEADASKKKGDADRLAGRVEENEEQLALARERRDAFGLHKERLVDTAARNLTEARRAVKDLVAPAVKGADKASKPKVDTEALEDKLGALRKKQTQLDDVRRDAENAGTRADAEVSRARRESDRYKDAPDTVCPECNQTVSKEHIRKKRKDALKDLAEATAAQTLAKQALLKALGDRNKGLDQVEEAEKAIATARREERLAQEDRDRYQTAVRLYERDLASLKEKVTIWENNLQNAKDQQDPNLATIKQLEEKLVGLTKEFEIADTDYRVSEVVRGRCLIWVTAFKEIRLALIDEVMVELEVCVNRHAEALGLVGWEIKFDTERQTQAGTVSHGFTAEIYPPNQGEPISWESYSGGESQRWNLAVAFGLSEVLLARSGIAPNVEILDEPTQHLHSSGIESLLEHLTERARETGRAIYLVDHHVLDRGAFDGAITVEKTNKGSTINRS